METKPDLPIILFESRQNWVEWLGANHLASCGIWMKIAKVGADTPSVTYGEAVEVALCFGWIDGQKQRHGEYYWLQRFTPRSDRSVWSKINKEKALALIEAGKMHAAGIEQIERAKRDGRWDAAYDAASRSSMPDDFHAALAANAEAKDFFAGLDGRNRYAMLFRVQTAKSAEVRAKRIAEFVRMLARHEKIHR